MIRSQTIATDILLRSVWLGNVSRPFRAKVDHRLNAARRRVSVASGGRLVFLVGTTRNDLQGIIWHRPLQRLCFIPRRAHPDVSLLISRQDHRHCLRMDRLDHRVRRAGEKSVNQVQAWYRLRAAIAFELRPDPGERCQRPIVIERELNHALLFGLGVGSGAYSAKLLNWREVTYIPVHDPEQSDDCGLVRRDRIQIAHGAAARVFAEIRPANLVALPASAKAAVMPAWLPPNPGGRRIKLAKIQAEHARKQAVEAAREADRAEAES